MPVDGHSVRVPPRHLVAVPRTAAPMSKTDLWDAVELLSRLSGEVARRKLGSDVFGQVDQARMVALGLYSTAREQA